MNAALGQNLVVSKGSKKWIGADDRHLSDGSEVANDATVSSGPPGCGQLSSGPSSAQDLGFAVPPSAVDEHSKLLGQNRDFLARLMSSASASHASHQHQHSSHSREEDENSSFLDVVESNNNAAAAAAAAAAAMSQYHHSAAANAVVAAGGAGAGGGAGTSSGGGGGNGGGAGGTTPTGGPSTAPSSVEPPQMQMNSLSHSQSFMSSFYNNANARLSGVGVGAGASVGVGVGANSSSASMLVEAALNSVGNMIDSESSDLKVPTENHINSDSPMSAHVDAETQRFGSGSGANGTGIGSTMDNLENELKMMKNLGSFPMQIPPLPMFQGACNISPSASTPTNPQSNQNQNDVDVDAGSTPRPQHPDSDGFSSSHHRTPPSPPPISPGRDYGGMFGAGNGAGGGPGSNSTPAGSSSGGGGGGAATAGGNNLSASSPLPALQPQRRNASSVGSTYPEHELISPASSPSIPRYNFNGDMMRHKRAVQEQEQQERRHNISRHNQMSSDEENSIMPQNSAGQDMRMKFPQSQIDLMYSKYESMASNLKYNSQDLDSPAEYRQSSNSNAASAAAVAAAAASAANDMSDLQGLDMSSRSNASSNYHHNFQLPSSRYHHHIYDILSDREQSQQSQAQQQSAASVVHQQEHGSHGGHSSQLQAMQQHQSAAMHNMLSEQLGEQEHDQTTSVDLSRTANYVVSSPPQLPYNHPHHDMLRMASLDLTPNTANMTVGNNRSFLSSQMQHQSRESLEHHRLLSTVEQHRILAASNAAADPHRLLVDPTAHLLMEQNNRLLGTADQSRLLGESAAAAAQNRHMARSFGAYHQVASSNYHPGVRPPPVLPSANHHASNPSNYHPFPAYY